MEKNYKSVAISSLYCFVILILSWALSTKEFSPQILATWLGDFLAISVFCGLLVEMRVNNFPRELTLIMKALCFFLLVRCFPLDQEPALLVIWFASMEHKANKERK